MRKPRFCCNQDPYKIMHSSRCISRKAIASNGGVGVRIVVLVKQVPGTDNVKMNPETGVMIRTGKDTVVNPLDEHALEEAVAIKSRFKGVRVTAISMGPPAAEKALRDALAMGVDDVVLLSHRAFGGADTIVTARTLAAAITKLGPADLILCGERATDGETGQVGPMVAMMLGLPVQTYVRKIELEENAVSIERIVEEGFERVRVEGPLVITVVKDLNQPRLPTLRSKLLARKAEVPVWGPAEISLQPEELGLKASPTRVTKVFSPSLSRDTELHYYVPGVTVRRLTDFLTQRDFISL